MNCQYGKNNSQVVYTTLFSPLSSFPIICNVKAFKGTSPITQSGFQGVLCINCFGGCQIYQLPYILLFLIQQSSPITEETKVKVVVCQVNYLQSGTSFAGILH